MSRVPQGIKVDYDVSSAKDAADKFAALLRQQVQGLDEFTVKVVRFNEKGALYEAVIEEMDAAGRKLATTIGLDKGAIDSVTQSFSNATSAAKALAVAQAQLATTGKTQSIIDKLIPTIPTDLPARLQSQLATAQSALNKTLATGALDTPTIDRLIDNMAKGLNRVEVGPARDLQQALLRVKTAVESINSELAKTNAPKAQSITPVGQAAQGVFPVPTSASTTAILSYNRALQQLQTVAAASGVSIKQVNDLLIQAAIAPGQFAAGIAKLPPTIQATATAVAQLQAATERAGTTGPNAVQSITISWQGLLRILEVQLFRRAISAVIDATKEGAQSAIDYGIKLQQVANLGQQSGAGITDLAKRVRDLSEAFGLPAIEILGAAQITLTNQVGNSAKAFQVLRQAMNLSLATGTDLQSATRTLTATLDAFGLSANESGRAANVLFLAAQRSRVPLDEFQSAIGRVGITARNLGLTLEETSAGFITLARQGGRPTESFALLTSILTKLEAPSREMQALFNSWGTSTAQLAIQTFGLGGVLDRLNEAIQRSPTHFAEIAGSMRNVRSLMGLTGQQSFNLSQSFQELTNNAGALGRATEASLVTPAQRIQKEFQSLKNVFTQDIGQDLIKNVVRVSDAFGGATQTLEALVAAAKVAGVAFLAYKVGIALTTVTQLGFVESLKATTRAAAEGSNAATLAFTAITVGIAAVINGNEQLEAQRIRFLNRDLTIREEARRKILEGDSQAASEGTRRYNQALSERTQPLLRFAAEIVAQSLETRDIQLKHQKDVMDGFRTGAQTFIDGIRKRVSDARHESQQAETDILTSQRRIASFEEQTRSRAFQRNLSFEQDPFAALNQINQRRAQLEAEATALFASGTRENVEAARSRFQELIRLSEEDTRRRVDIARTQHDIDIAEGRAVRELDAFGRERYILRLNLNGAQQEALRLQGLETAAEQNLVALRQREREAANAAAATNLANLRTTEFAARRLEEFRIFGTDNRLLPEFRDVERRRPGTGTQAGLEEFDRRAAALRQSAAEATARAEEEAARARETGRTPSTSVEDAIRAQAELERRIQDLRRSFEVQIANQTRADEAELFQLRLGNEIRIAQERRSQLQTTIAAETAFINAAGTRADRALTRLREVVGAQEPGRFFDPNTRRPAFEAFDAQALTTSQALSATRLETRAGIEAAQAQITSLRATLDRLAAPVQTRGGVLSPDINADTARRAREQLDAAQTAIDAATQQQNSRERRQAELAETNARLTEFEQRSAALPARFQNAAAALVEAGNAANNIFDTPLQRLQSIVTGLERVRDLIGAPLGPLPALPPLAAQPLREAMGGLIPRFAQGGPSGTDTIPAWLSPGEFVVNAANTRKWYSQLVDINAGRQPKFFNQGGPVTTVGDVHVTVQGGETSEKTVRQIGLALQREIKRGTIKLT